MTQHYKDNHGNVYGYKPANIEVVPVTIEEAKAIIESQKPVPEPPTIEQIYALRAAAYADPHAGSDRHFLEAARKRAEDDTEGADAATQAGLARVTEIKAEYPLP